MSPVAHAGQPLTAAVFMAVDNALGEPGYVTRPPDAAQAPYWVLHPLSLTLDGTLSDSLDADVIYQVTCVGVGPEQAEGMADAARAALVMQTIPVTGRTLLVLHYSSIPITVDEDTRAPLFLARDQYRIHSYAA